MTPNGQPPAAMLDSLIRDIADGLHTLGFENGKIADTISQLVSESTERLKLHAPTPTEGAPAIVLSHNHQNGRVILSVPQAVALTPETTWQLADWLMKNADAAKDDEMQHEVCGIQGCKGEQKVPPSPEVQAEEAKPPVRRSRAKKEDPQP